MKLIEFENNKGKKLFINPEKVTYLMTYKDDYTYIYFDTAKAEAQTRVTVVGRINEISSRLQFD